MILVDTSVWVGHLRTGDKTLIELLDVGQVLVHPFVIGEVALGSLRQRRPVLSFLSKLPRVSIASEQEVLQFIDQHSLFNQGIGYVDVHLLAAVRLTAGAALWTGDKRLHEAADRLGLTAKLPS